MDPKMSEWTLTTLVPVSIPFGKSCPGQTNELYSFILWHFGSLEKALGIGDHGECKMQVVWNQFKVIGSRKRIPQNWMVSY